MLYTNIVFKPMCYSKIQTSEYPRWHLIRNHTKMCTKMCTHTSVCNIIYMLYKMIYGRYRYTDAVTLHVNYIYNAQYNVRCAPWLHSLAHEETDHGQLGVAMDSWFLFGNGCCGDLRLVDCHGPSHSAAGSHGILASHGSIRRYLVGSNPSYGIFVGFMVNPLVVG